MSESTQIAVRLQEFELLQRQAKAHLAATMVPPQYRGPDNIGNCMIAIGMAHRMNIEPMLVMQNLHIVNGRPVWSAKFLIACFNKCGRFTSIRYKFNGKSGDEWGCRAICMECATGETVEGTEVTLGMARAEGWLDKKGSKWLTMPEQMLKYRAAAFLINSSAPELSVGIMTEDEAADSQTGKPAPAEEPRLEAVAGAILPRITPFQKGKRAFASGLRADANPYPKSDTAHAAWREGYLDAQGPEIDADIGFDPDTGEIENGTGTDGQDDSTS
jgi:hypothetical protein